MNPRVLLLAGILLFVTWLIVRASRTARYSLQDKVALITGGSRGLGLVLARQMCEAGGKVALIARDPGELARAKADLAPRGGVVFTIQCDLLDAAQIQSAVRQIIDRLGKIDILINNAGIIEVGPLEHMSHEDFERALSAANSRNVERQDEQNLVRLIQGGQSNGVKGVLRIEHYVFVRLAQALQHLEDVLRLDFIRGIRLFGCGQQRKL